MRDESNVVEGIDRHLELYLETTRKLTAILDHENQMLLFEEGETQVLRDGAKQAAKQALYARVETLARIVTRTLEVGNPAEVSKIRDALLPVEGFRRSLRLNSALLEVCIERQERRMRRIMRMIETTSETPTDPNPEAPHVADHSL
jgi:hypothetical protein